MQRVNFCSKKKYRGTSARWFLVLPYHGNGLYWSTTQPFEKDDYILETVSQKAIFEENYALKPEWTNNDFTPVKHTFSHQKWTIEMVEGSVNDDKLTTDKELCWVAAEDFDQFPNGHTTKEND